MNCPACGHDNPGDAAFCGECAASLAPEIECPSCRRRNPARQKFCHGCATPLTAPATSDGPERDPRAYTPKHLAHEILQSKNALEGERKQVTVLFADVKGSMDLAEQVDPEEWHRILNRFFEILTDGVHRFEGTVNQYTGDGIMALFGAPIAHEDHARRACYAALHLSDEIRSYADELRRTRGLSFSVRMGLNSGEVVVGKIGDDLRMDYTAQGHTVGIAARVEAVAAPDRVYLADATANLVTGYVQLRDLGEFDLKGVREPVRIHELQGIGQLRSRLDLSRARGFSRFVGRVEEMQVLEMALERAEKGNPQILGIVGEPGVGKSRLCFEFLERCRARGVMSYETSGVAHGKAIPLLPMLKLFRGFFGITEQDSDVTARERIAGRLLLLGEKFRDVLPVIFDFMGMPDPETPAPKMDPEARQRQIVSVIKGVTQARAGRETSVTLLEDLHWFDSASETYLEALLDAPPGSRGLIVLNFRPEYRADWMQRPHYQQVPLVPLGAEAIAELLADVLGSDPTLARLPELIRGRTGGNPFFTEEVVNSLAESGHLEGSRGSYRLAIPIEEIAVPSTVQAVLAARIDRLVEREKQVLQIAAVIGKTFAESVLARAGELPKQELATALHELKSGDFIYETALYPVAQYVFKHPLTQEVALGSQLKERRARVHAAVAQAIEELNPDKLDDQAAEIAYHWEEAGEKLEAARWHRRAARRAGANSPREAQQHWGRVKKLAHEVAESDEALALGLEGREQILNFGWRLGIPREEADALFHEGRALARRRGDRTAETRMLLIYGVVLYLSGAPRDSLAPLEAGLALADTLEGPGLRYSARAALWNAHYHLGNLDRALAYSDEGLKMAEADPHLGEELFGMSCAWAYGYRALILFDMVRHEQIPRLLRRCEEIAREFDEHDVLSWTELVRSKVAHSRGDGPGALRHAAKQLEHAERTGSAFNLGLAWTSHGKALGLMGEWQQARQSFERSVETIRASGSGLHEEPRAIAWLAEACLELGDEVRARAAADEAIRLTRERELYRLECEALLTRARVLAHFDGVAARPAIEEALERTDELIEQTGARLYEPTLEVGRAELAELLGDMAARDRHLREAHRLYAEMGATGHAERVGGELGL